MIYNFQTMTKKDLFKIKLTNETIHFGRISRWQLKNFIKFCKKYKLITPQEYRWYEANYSFSYISTVSRTNFKPLAYIMIWLSDILNHHFTHTMHCFRTGYQTVYISDHGTQKISVHMANMLYK